VADPAQITDVRYRRFARRAQIDGLLADHLVRGEPYLALDALVLSRRDLTQLRDLTEAFSRAFDRAGRALAADVARLGELGFPWAAAELLAVETPRVPLLGRFDFVRDESGRWRLLEFNADTPSGVREAIVAERVLCRLLPRARELVRPTDGLEEALVRAFADAVAGLPRGAALGLVTDAGELEDLAQMAFTRRVLDARLGERGVPVVLGDVDNLWAATDGLRLRGQRVGALYRYFPFEQAYGTPAFAATFDAVASGRLRLLNGLYGLLLQNKAVLAWLWEHRDDPRFPADERRAIRGHLPPTWRIADVTDHTGDPSVVVKQVFGREGEEVFFGDALDATTWRELRTRRTYVVQERVPIAPVRVVIPTSSGPRRECGRATVGAFAVDGRWAGFYTRFGGKIITSRAKWLATLVEQKEGEKDGQWPIE
jgi:glutathionylspermidine synthase